MISTTLSQLNLCSFLTACLLTVPMILAQEEQKTSFYDVTMGSGEIYKYSGLRFRGDYVSFESPSGVLALGRTEAGVTVVILLGGGTVTIEAADAAQEKFRSVFGTYPLKTEFTTLYMRLHPKEFEEVFGRQTLTKAPDEAAAEKAKEIFDQRFLASYHAGPRAILPPYKTRVLDFETAQFGQLTNEEGYWVRLNRITPFARIYPPNFVNPKQK
ncbi:MAG: hypothetical protein HXY20_11240 [Acidobacteria bacterium]|nr:hypothetical protein [Acidobacteriota bacterium]